MRPTTACEARTRPRGRWRKATLVARLDGAWRVVIGGKVYAVTEVRHG